MARRLALASIAIVCVAAAFLIGPVSHGHGFLQKVPPQWASWELARTLLLAAGGIAAMLCVRPASDGRRPELDERLTRARFALVLAASLGVAVFGIAIMLVSPSSLYAIVTEMSFTETASELMLAAAVLALGFSAWRMRGRASERVFGLSASTVCWIMAAVMVMLLMEETSYGQHWLGFATPDAFDANLQHETNLHNFATHKVELVFYSAAIAAFVILPFAWPARPDPRIAGLSWYVPPRGFAVLGAGTAGYMFATFAIIPLQAAFFMTLAVLVAMALDARERGVARAAWTAVCMLALAELVFLRTGPGLIAGYEPDELRELQIALMIFVYSLWLWRKATETAAGATPRSARGHLASSDGAKAA